VSRIETTRRIVSAAAVGGGSVSAIGLGLYGVLRTEAFLARKAIGDPLDDPPPNASGWYGRKRPGPAIRIALLGDSAAAGYGVDNVEETPGAHLASGVAAAADRRVYLGCFAVVGAQTSDLMDQVDRALLIEPEIAVISIGANDVTHGVLPGTSIKLLDECLQRLHAAGVRVVMGTCPDLGTIRPIGQPLRQVARYMSRRMATEQAIAVVQAGARSVSLANTLGPEFDARPTDLFGPDQFHPSAEGYAAFAGVLLPTTLAALGLVPDEAPLAARGEGLRPTRAAASQAARSPGTELDGTKERGVRGLLVELRHRRRQPQVTAEKPAADLESAEPA
jgi:lysophospholipase L1-like esterase